MIRAALCLFILVEFSIASFFHTQTYSLTNDDSHNDSYFGYSLEYQDENKRLIVGGPKHDLDGQIYSCPLEKLNQRNACNPMVSVHNLMEDSDRSRSPEQNFWLGASVVASEDYVFTCAPLMTGNIDIISKNQKKTYYEAYGTCFIVYNNENVTRLNGLLEQYRSMKEERTINLESFSGGVGWDTLIDDTNDVLLISKPALTSNIMYTSAKNPMQPVVSVNFGFNNEFKSKPYKGWKFAAGNFFSVNKTVYAFSLHDSKLRGSISFLHVVNGTVNVMKNGKRPEQVQSKKLGIGFGAALNSADLNNDGYSDLLVGAPLQAEEDGFNAGAIYIYVGGQIVKKKNDPLSIAHRKHGAHFGTAIASLDLDGDNYPEIFVSAPFEDGGGSVYVIPGYTVNKLLKARENTFVTDIQSHQRINSNHQSFGYSLKPIADYNGDGGNFLVIGAPLSSAVEIYISIPTINVTISAYLKGKEMVRELDQNFTVTVKVDVHFPPKPENISGNLLVTTSIGDGVRAVISSDKSYTIKLLRHTTTYTNDIVVTLNDQRPGFYTFTATVAAKPQDDSAESSVRLSAYSTVQKDLPIVRKCKGDECVPRLSMDVTWNGPKRYVLGSSSSETVAVVIKNDGNTSYESCAKIKIVGAQIKDSECVEDGDSSYTCKFVELEREKMKVLPVQLDMTRSSNKDDKLEVDVVLYSRCPSINQNFDNSTQKKITVMYDLDTSNIKINEYALDLKVSDQEIADLSKSETIDVHEKYKITNNGSVRWENIRAVLSLKRRSLIKSYFISEQETIICDKSEDEDNFVYNCTLSVDKQSEVFILTTINIFKDKIAVNLQDDELRIVSELHLHLDPTEVIKNSTSITTVIYKKDLSFGHQKSYVLVIAILVAVMIVLIIGIILYKRGFFKRTEKEKLKELKARVSQDAGPSYASNISLVSTEDILTEEEVENTAEECESSVTVHKEE